jgi:hypothetical protein
MLLECMDYQHMTKDRSLGSVEVKVSDLAATSDGDARFPYTSTGKRVAADPIKLDRGAYKGQLYYVAEFIPAMAVRGVGFAAGPNQLERAAAGAGGEDDGDVAADDEGGSMSSSDVEAQKVPLGVTVSRPLGDESRPQGPEGNGRHVRNAKSTDTTRTAESTSTRVTAKTAETRPEEVGQEMSTDELLSHGALAFLCLSVSGRADGGHRVGRGGVQRT